MPGLLALLLALSSSAAPPATAAGAAPRAPARVDAGIVRLRFAWPAPGRARVAYRRTRVGPAGRTAFTARWEERVEPDGGALRISARSTSWRGDLPVPRALARDAIRASEAVVQRVGAGGEFRGLDGVEAMRPVLARVLEEAKVPPEAAERAVALALGEVRTDAEEAWNLAVGFWAGADLALGQTYALESVADLPLLRGVRAEQAVEFAVRRRVPCAAGEPAPRCVEVTLQATPDRAAVDRAAEPLLARLFAPGEERPEAAARDLTAESELVLVTEPETLLPRRVVWTKAVRLAASESGPPRAELVDRSEWDYRYLAPEPPRGTKRPRPEARRPGSGGAEAAGRGAPPPGDARPSPRGR